MRLTKDVFSAILYGGKLYSKPKKKEKIMNKKHFTLVEVLVVVGIIGILAGLIIPAVGLARQAGRRTECVSNQGQLMKLLTTTMQANDSYLVSGGSYNTANDADSAWTRYLYDKNKLLNVKGYRCSGLQTAADPALGSSVTNVQLQAALGVVEAKKPEGGKSFSGFDFRGTRRLTISGGTQISPNQLSLGGCSAVIDGDQINPRANLLSSDKTKAYFTVAHGEDFNMFFLDGHVETVSDSEAEKKYIPDPEDGTGAVEVEISSHIKKIDD